jgi:hypothetical protein
MREGTVNEQGEVLLMQILVLASAAGGESYTSRVPRILQRASLPLVAALGRLRGYKPSYD